MAPGVPTSALQERALVSAGSLSPSTARGTCCTQNAATGHLLRRPSVAAFPARQLLSKKRIPGANARAWTKLVAAGVLKARLTSLSGPSPAFRVEPEAGRLLGPSLGSAHKRLDAAEGGRRSGAVRAAALDTCATSSTSKSAMRQTRWLAAPLLSLLAILVPGSALAATAQTLSAGAAKAASGAGASPLVLSDISNNAIFMSALIAWALAQSLKVVTTWWTDKVLDWRMLFASGGMPSSHSAMCCGLTAAVSLLHGLAGPLFPICLAFTLIVMYDATSVRYHAGVQAKVLNVVVEEMLQGHPVSEKKLKEILGHTPLQVAGGAMLGVVVALLYNRGLWL